VGVFHQGSELSCSPSVAGYRCAILTVFAKMAGSRLATGRSPYLFGAAPGCDQHPQSSQLQILWSRRFTRRFVDGPPPP